MLKNKEELQKLLAEKQKTLEQLEIVYFQTKGQVILLEQLLKEDK